MKMRQIKKNLESQIMNRKRRKTRGKCRKETKERIDQNSERNLLIDPTKGFKDTM
jgi:hypothetical protein